MNRMLASFFVLFASIALPLSAIAQSSAGSAAGCGAGIGGLIGLAINIAIAYYIYTDAKKRGQGNEVLWGVLGFFTGLIGLVIYLLVRKK